MRGGPTWFVAAAPAIRHAEEVCAAQSRQLTHVLSFTVWREAWTSAFEVPDAELSWRRVTGPLMALKVSLRWARWSLPSFCVMGNGFQADILITTCLPAL
eukprot:5953430-Pyramimonas_sp.AAC.1